MFKGIIFDMDGVIIDSEPMYMEIDKKFFKDHDICFNDEEIESYVGVNMREVWGDILKRFNLEHKHTSKDMYEKQMDSFYKNMKDNEELTLMDGLEEWLKYFKEKKVKMIIASSNHDKVIKLIYDKFNLDNYMIGYVDGNTVENGKPAPDIFLKAAEKLELNPKDCLVIEDSQNGVKAAKSAGMKCVGFNNRESEFQSLDRADIVIDHFNRENLNKVINMD
ncbi:HAD family phosphatase [Clostridium sp. D2Q-14]|uniref:HAD family hydrolase n=1 Tax=Anaeromonas gelatinilytica TaxID=2683194 RepID=UPI00193C0A8C|nr:HAD family phosphatase [Anaeromonas gelatinilytica]MBS4535749.1 HAD family phosphatase [Anaeromonas gelatinilytica]